MLQRFCQPHQVMKRLRLQCQQDFLHSYNRYRSDPQNATKNIAQLMNCQNAYVLKLRAVNRMKEEFYYRAQPHLLEVSDTAHH